MLKHRRTPDRRARMAELNYQKARILSEYFSNIAKALNLKFYQMERMHAENAIYTEGVPCSIMYG